MSDVGHTHVIPVPFGMSVEEAWAEITTLGHLAVPPLNDDECGWSSVECDGEECASIDKAPDFRRYHNDIQIEGPPRLEEE